MGFVAIHRDVFNDDISDAGALQKREIGRDSGIALEMETLLQTAIEFEAISRIGDQRSLNDIGALAVGIFADETDAVTHLKPLRIGQGDFLIPMVAVHDQFGGDGRLLEEHRVCPASQEADFRLKKNRVAQSVRARQNTDCAASAPRDVINRGLDHPIRGADEIRLLGANREREALLPVRFGGIPEDRSWVGVPGKVVGAGKH